MRNKNNTFFYTLFMSFMVVKNNEKICFVTFGNSDNDSCKMSKIYFVFSGKKKKLFLLYDFNKNFI